MSETFVWNIAEQLNQIKKPIYAYYLGDHDPAGLRIEASLQSRLYGFCNKGFHWKRLAVTSKDFADLDLLGFPVKRTGARGSWQPYIDQHGDRCVEVDAISPDEIRKRVRRAIERHIDMREWEKLQTTEDLERETLRSTLLVK